MTDDRFSDTEPADDALDGLGLESLTEGAHASADQWSAISSTAAHRRHRRAWILAAAAMVVLVVGTAAVVLNRTGDNGVIDVAAGGLSADVRLLPPNDAVNVTAERLDGAGSTNGLGSVIVFDDADGRSWVLRQGLPRQVLDAQGHMPTDDTMAGGPGTVEVAPFGTVWLTCAGYASAGDTTGSAITWVGPATALFAFGDGAAFVSPNTDGTSGSDAACTADDAVVDAVRGLRVVSLAEYEKFLGTVPVSIPEVTQTIIGGNDGGVQAPVTASTLPEDPPADRGSAEEQIAAAVAGFSDQAADGSFPNLEGGTAKATEYGEMFDLARRQSGADQGGDLGGNTSKVSRIRFVSPERASITIEFTAKLPTGTFTFGQEGEAILQDGRWVVTYRTVTTTLRRACVPPGGYDGCPTADSNGVVVAPAN
jgi:hypothetical protein